VGGSIFGDLLGRNDPESPARVVDAELELPAPKYRTPWERTEA
jgi:hypothetical protein